MNKKNIFIITVIVLCTLGCALFLIKKGPVHFSQSHKKVLRLALDNSTIDSLDPAKSYSDDSLLLSAQVLEPLYQYHYLKRPYEVQALVADGLPIIQDQGRLITIKIKKGIFYHDHPSFGGKKRELMAQDFIVQLKRIALEGLKSPGKNLFTGLIVGFSEYGKKIQEDWRKIPYQDVEGIKALDSHVLQIKLLKPEPNIIYFLALNFVSPLPWELVEFQKNQLDHVLIGTGPFEYRGYQENHFLMEKFKNYRTDYYPTSGDRYANIQKLLDSSKEKIPFIDQIQFYVTTEENQRWEMFLKKEVDILNVPKTLIPRIYNQNGALSSELEEVGAELKHFPILANRWFGINMHDPVLGKNKFLRLAIAHAINYDQYIQIISQNTNLRANSLLVPGISGYRPTRDFRFNYDLSKSREYLAKAKLKQLPVITYSTRGNQGINIVEAKFVKDQLEKIGLKVQIEILTFSDFLKKGRAGELMFFTDNWLFDYPDGENILQLLVSTNFPGINKSGYSNPVVDELYLKLKQTINLDHRDRLLHQIEDLILDDVPWIPLMYESSLVLQYPEIKNYRKSSLIRNYIKYLKIER